MRKLLATIVAALCLGSQASAFVVGGGVSGGSSFPGGSFVLLSTATPFNVLSPTLEGPDLYAFDEQQAVVLPAALTMDFGTSPSAGQTVASHYVFFNATGTGTLVGYVDFDQPILGVATSRTTLKASDFLGSPNVTYLDTTMRGLEPKDSIWVMPGQLNRLYLSLRTSTPGDYIRVLTTPGGSLSVPLPASLPLMLGGLAVFGLLRRKRAA